MRTKATVLLGAAAVGFALLTVAGQSRREEERVLLSPNPPKAPRWGLEWELWQFSEPRPAAATPAGNAGPAGEPGHPSDVHAQGVSDVEPSVWSTEAEWSESD